MILVIGAAGNVGSAVVYGLRASGHLVRPAYHSGRDVPCLGDGRGEAVTLDLSEPGTLPPALEGIDRVFLLSATGPDQTRQELNLVAAARAAGIERVVKLSVWRADEELTPIARAHRPVEEALRSSGLAWTFLRPNFYMQNFVRQMADSIKANGSFTQPVTAAAISFVDARDVARVAVHVLMTAGHEGRIYALTGPQALSFDQAAIVLSGVIGSEVRFIGLSDDEARADMLRHGLPERYVETLIEVSRAYRNGGAERITNAARDLTGLPATTFATFAHDHAVAFT